jgi:hypothetical protein
VLSRLTGISANELYRGLAVDRDAARRQDRDERKGDRGGGAAGR